MATGARPPVAAFFLRRVIVWGVLVCACALPLAMATAPRFTPGERAAEGLGVFVWVAAMVIIGERLRWPSEARSPLEALHLVMWHRWSNREADRRSATLRTGALVAAIIHSGLAIVAGPLGLFIWFMPAIWIGSRLPPLRDPGSDFWGAFLWTLICGAQSAIVAWLSGRALATARDAFERRFASHR